MVIDTRLNYEDYCLLPDNGRRYEIIDGDLFVTPSPLWQPLFPGFALPLSKLAE